jgi:hypothetical protein
MYQMTDAAFAETRRYCVRRHTVVEDGCLWNALYTRIVPSHAIELAAVFLDRNVTEILGHRPNTATPQQKQELAAVIHLCGASTARVFARRGFSLIAGERCGDHDVAAYLAELNAMKLEFLVLLPTGRYHTLISARAASYLVRPLAPQSDPVELHPGQGADAPMPPWSPRRTASCSPASGAAAMSPRPTGCASWCRSAPCVPAPTRTPSVRNAGSHSTTSSPTSSLG